MILFEERLYKKEAAEKIAGKNDSILAVDIGGTNTDFGLLHREKGKVKLLISFHFRSRDVTDFTAVVEQVLDHLREKYRISPRHCCVAGAGVVSKNGTYIKITNLPWSVDTSEIQKKTGLAAIAINDFQAFAYGIEALPKKSIKTIKKGKPAQNGTLALLGAGTGLGKAILLFDEDKKCYVPFPSEGGHAELIVTDKNEYEFAEFVRSRSKSAVVTWEDALSGNGIRNIYLFLGKDKKYSNTKYTVEIEKSGCDPQLIAKYQENDAQCKDTFTMFLAFYGRCAKNFALDILAEGGVYIAGGIAGKNIGMFQNKAFTQELTRTKKLQEVLQNIPVYVITDYNVSLYGAAVAALRIGLKEEMR